jgi:beta-fructofuranosidase
MHSLWRQALHLEPPEGWLNDPNGLGWFGGLYHVFFQYCPENVFGSGLKRWGHYVSSDLVSWRFAGAPLAPDTPWDCGGVYSGSTLTADGKMQLFYTGNVKHPGNFDYILAGREANVLRATSSDGFQMGKKQLLLTPRDYPSFCSCHVRDPKVWKDERGYWMVLGARSRSGLGSVLLYRSDDTERWRYCANIRTADPFGYMWECPDYFTLKDRGILSVSPQGLQHEKARFQNIYQSGWFPVEGPLEEGRLGAFTEWDYGFDFYAPQTFQAPDGRRLLIAWMGLPDSPYANPTIALGFQNCLTLPREVFFDREGRLCQRPVRELNALCGTPQIRTGSAALPFRLQGEISGSFRLTLDGGLTLQYDAEESIAVLRFTDPALGCGRTERFVRLPRVRNLDLIADTSSVEIYLDGGAAVLSARFYPAQREISLACEGFSPVVQPMRIPEMNIEGAAAT